MREGSGDLSARFYPANLSNGDKEIWKTLDLGVVLVHTVSFCTRDIEANRCFSLILVWSTDYASEQSTLDIEENHQIQKTGEI